MVLDTNVVSELMRATPSPAVVRWLRQATMETFATTVITAAEIEYGIVRLPESRRRAALAERFDLLISDEFGFSVLPLDEPAARLAGHFRMQREDSGLNAQFADMLIAGIAANADAAIASRNRTDFTGLGLEVTNPWD